jgi:hypothetical protein
MAPSRRCRNGHLGLDRLQQLGQAHPDFEVELHQAEFGLVEIGEGARFERAQSRCDCGKSRKFQTLPWGCETGMLSEDSRLQRRQIDLDPCGKIAALLQFVLECEVGHSPTSRVWAFLPVIGAFTDILIAQWNSFANEPECWNLTEYAR